MAWAPRRSANAELSEGMTDGKYKKVTSRERGGVIEASTQTSRHDLDDLYYGIHEEPMKVRPDGKVVSTPNYVATPRPDANSF